MAKKTNSQLPNPNSSPKLRVALVCDWLVGTGGAERVVLELHKMFPDAPIYTSQYNPDPKIWYGDKWFAGADIKTTRLQKLPNSLRKFLPVLRAWSFSRLDLSGYDLVISSSGAEAKGVRTTPKPSLGVRIMQLAGAHGADEERKGGVHRSTLTAHRSPQQSETAKSASGVGGSAAKQTGTVHISYIHAPTHYYWSRYEEYLKNPGFSGLDPVARLGLKLLVGPMRRWDKKAAGRPDYMIANSSHTKAQIKKYYDREAEVIHPPVDIERFKSASRYERHGFITAGRQTPYKRIDLAVAACTKLNLPLTVIGNGPDHEKLKTMAGTTVKFLTDVPDEDMPLHFQKSEAFLFPGTDDFGIVAVEALAAGTPVIAYKAGGALDYVNPNSGLLFYPQSVEGLIEQLEGFSKKEFDHSAISDYASNFSTEDFRQKIMRFTEKHLEKL